MNLLSKEIAEARPTWLSQLSGEKLVNLGGPATLHDENVKEVAGNANTPIDLVARGLILFQEVDDMSLCCATSWQANLPIVAYQPLPERVLVIHII